MCTILLCVFLCIIEFKTIIKIVNCYLSIAICNQQQGTAALRTFLEHEIIINGVPSKSTAYDFVKLHSPFYISFITKRNKDVFSFKIFSLAT
jgi:hypothetical protein